MFFFFKGQVVVLDLGIRQLMLGSKGCKVGQNPPRWEHTCNWSVFTLCLLLETVWLWKQQECMSTSLISGICLSLSKEGESSLIIVIYRTRCVRSYPNGTGYLTDIYCFIWLLATTSRVASFFLFSSQVWKKC